MVKSTRNLGMAAEPSGAPRAHRRPLNGIALALLDPRPLFRSIAVVPRGARTDRGLQCSRSGALAQRLRDDDVACGTARGCDAVVGPCGRLRSKVGASVGRGLCLRLAWL